MYNIVIDYVYSHIDSKLPTDILINIDNKLRYRQDGYEKTWKFQHSKWDGYIHTFNILTQQFRTGLAWRVARIFEDSKLPFNIVDLRKPAEKSSTVSEINLKLSPYPYQIEAASTTTQQTHGLIASPTGTGKTIMMALTARMHGVKTLIVTNSVTLLDQTHEFFDSIVPGGAGIVGAGDFELKDLTIATIQTICTILGFGGKKGPTDKAPAFKAWLDNLGLVIHDEVHGADNDSVDMFYASLKCPNFVGMTATPFAWAFKTEKGANLEMEQHFGCKIYDSRDKVDFVKLGVTVPLYIQRLFAPVVELYKGITNGKGFNYKEVLDTQVINNKQRTEMVVQKATEFVRSNMSCYIFYQRLSHGKEIFDLISATGIKPEILSGVTTKKERKRIFSNVENKKTLVVVSDIGSYGLNIRSLDCVILAHPVRDFRQIKGRVCRSYPNKKYGLVVDIVDRVPFLLSHSNLRVNQAKQDEDTIIG